MNYIRSLEALGCRLVRSDADLDFVLPDITALNTVRDYLESKGFVQFYHEPNKINFKKFENAVLIDIDIELDLETEFLKIFFYDVHIDEMLKRRYIKDPESYRQCVDTIRYVLLLRGFDVKYRNFFERHKRWLQQHGYCLSCLHPNPFKKEFVSFDDFLDVMTRKKAALLKYIPLKYLVRMYKRKLFKKRGRVIAFVGADGSGKTTIIDILQKNFGYRVFYLGDRSVKGTYLYRIPWLKPFSVWLQYLEKLSRMSFIYLVSLKGKHVLLDRCYCQFDTSGVKGRLYDILYNKLFFQPDRIIVLYHDAQVLRERKPEMTAEEIKDFYRKIRKSKFGQTVMIKNDHLDDTLNQILLYLA